MPSLMNGLSAAGAGMASFANSAGLEAQKADLQMQSITLANQLQHASRTAEIAQQGTIQSGIVGQQTASQERIASGENAARVQAATIGAGAQTAAAGIEAGAQKAVATIQATALPPDVRTALAMSKAPPEVRATYFGMAALRGGIPPDMLGPGFNYTGTGAPAAPAPSGTSGSTPAPTGTQPVAPAPAAAPGGAFAPPPGGYNEHALDDLSPGLAAQIKAIASGRMAPLNTAGRNGLINQDLMQHVLAYDPSYDGTRFAIRQDTIKDFTTGQAARNIVALNTALGHADVLSQAFLGLGNGQFPSTNAAVNFMKEHLGNDKITTAQQAVAALASEARKVFASGNGSGNLTELESWEKNFPINGSPGQQQAAMADFAHLMGGRMDALANQYSRGTGEPVSPVHFLDPAALKVYQRFSAEGQPTAQQPHPAQNVAAAPADAGARRMGESYLLPNGKIGVWRGAGWEVSQ